MAKTTKSRLNILSPDGFPIHPTKTYANKKQAIEELKKWIKRYEKQGYYSSLRFGKIDVWDIPYYSKLIKAGDEVKEGLKMMSA